MEFDLNGILSNYRERVQRLAIFDPLFKLENKKAVDRNNKPIDHFSLGLLAILFFYENMLIRNRKTGARELAEFYQHINHGEIDLDTEGYEKLARSIIDVFRPPSGRRNSRDFYNWGTRQAETVYYSILKADKYDVATNSQYYTLDDDGLELVFATREYFSEFQISISQLLLRKQLEKGEFVGALRQIDEMRVAVQNLQERITRIKHEIQRSIVSEKTYQRFKETVEDINLRLTRENEEFEELEAFVRDTKQRLGYEMSNERDRRAYELIVQIDRELGEVHYQHSNLLKESIVLKTSALQAAQESLYYVGITSFNFQKEITDRLISTPLPLMAARQLIEPFLYLERWTGWSPLAVFAPQRVAKKTDELLPDYFEEPEDFADRTEQSVLRRNFGYIMKIILEMMGEKDSITLEEVVQFLQEGEYQKILAHHSFYHFWLLLHQTSPIAARNGHADYQGTLLAEAVDLLRERGADAVVTEQPGMVQVFKRFRIQNLELRLERND